MKISKYLLVLSKSKINLTKKEKLFLELNQLKKINSCKIRFLEEKEIEGIRAKYDHFIKIIEFSGLLEKAKEIFAEEGKKIGKIRFNGTQRIKTSFRLSVPQVKLILTK